jgi:hypothetical protein
VIEEIVTYNFRVVPSGKMSTANFIQTCQVVLELNQAGKQADRQTQPALYAFISWTSCKKCIKRNKRKKIKKENGKKTINVETNRKKKQQNINVTIKIGKRKEKKIK